MQYVLPLLALLALGVPAAEDLHQLRTHITPGANGTFVVAIEVLAPGSAEVAAATKLEMAPGNRRWSRPRGDDAFVVDVNVDRHGRGLAKLEVSKHGERVSSAIALLEVEPPAGYVRLRDLAKPPRVVRRVYPFYPETARKNRVSGVVILDVKIDANGLVQDVAVMTEPGSGLGVEAMKAVRQWKFAPTIVDGKAVPIAFLQMVDFRL